MRFKLSLTCGMSVLELLSIKIQSCSATLTSSVGLTHQFLSRWNQFRPLNRDGV
jgi:hypothetical protein